MVIVCIDIRARVLENMSPTLSQSFMNFGVQMALKRTGGFARPDYFVLSQSTLCGISVAPHSDSK